MQASLIPRAFLTFSVLHTKSKITYDMLLRHRRYRQKVYSESKGQPFVNTPIASHIPRSYPNSWITPEVQSISVPLMFAYNQYRAGHFDYRLSCNVVVYLQGKYVRNFIYHYSYLIMRLQLWSTLKILVSFCLPEVLCFTLFRMLVAGDVC